MSKEKKLVPELRFGKFTEEYSTLKISDIYESYSGLRGKSKDHFKEEGERFITYKQVFDNSKISNKYGNVIILENENQNLVEYGDVFFTISSETAKEVGISSVFLNKEKTPLYLNSFCIGMRLKSKKMIPEFSRFLFRAQPFRKEIEKLAQGSTRYNISKVKVMNLKFRLPTIEEQNKIANFLTAIDRECEIDKIKIKLMKDWKKGLLQRMFV